MKLSRAEALLFVPVAGVAATLAGGCKGAERGRGARRPAAGDGPALQSLLRLEHLAVAFYDEVLAERLLRPAARRHATEFSRHEREHLARLEHHAQRLRVLIPRPAKVVFSFRGREDEALEAATAVENVSAGAMAGQLARLHDPWLIREVVSILAVEAGHAAALERLSRAAVGDPMPDQGVDGLRPGPFERPLERDDVPRLLERVGIEL